MGFGKRQLVLAALVVSLGAAVYLNWQFSGDNQIVATNASTQQNKELGETQLVNGSASSITPPPSSASSTASKATESTTSKTTSASSKTVSSTASTTSKPESAVSAAADAGEDYFNQARLDRQKTRDTAIELLEKVTNDKAATEADKKKAIDDAAAIAQDMLKESNIENLIKSKGYTDCVVFLQNGECSVVVKKTTAFAESDAVTIRDVITSQTEVPYNKIKIVEAK